MRWRITGSNDGLSESMSLEDAKAKIRKLENEGFFEGINNPWGYFYRLTFKGESLAERLWLISNIRDFLKFELENPDQRIKYEYLTPLGVIKDVFWWRFFAPFILIPSMTYQVRYLIGESLKYGVIDSHPESFKLNKGVEPSKV